MPNRPPTLFLPGARAYRNGHAARSQHAADTADYTAWLVAVRRHAKPAFIGRPLVAGPTYELRTQIPHYTEFLAFGLLVTGEGEVSVTLTDDTWDCEVPVEAGGTHDLNDAQWIWVMTPLGSVGADGSLRALDATDQSDPHMSTVTVTITDGASLACRVHSMILWPLPRSQGSTMPA